MEKIISDDPASDPKYEVEHIDLESVWPDDVNVAVCLTYDTQGAIDGFREGYQTTTWGESVPNYSDYSERQYGITEGLPRILDIHDKHDVKGTFPTCGLTAEWYPSAIEEIKERGHEVANHSHYHRLHAKLSEEEIREDIEKSTDALADVTGEQPRGWRTPLYSTAATTIDRLIDHDYVWDSSFHNYDKPYLLTDGESDIIEIPASMDDFGMYLMATDSEGTAPHMGGYPYGSPKKVYDTIKWEFDRLYQEGKESGVPRTFVFTMHPKVSGRPNRAACLDKFLEYAKGKEGVWFPTLSNVAELIVEDT